MFDIFCLRFIDALAVNTYSAFLFQTGLAAAHHSKTLGAYLFVLLDFAVCVWGTLQTEINWTNIYVNVRELSVTCKGYEIVCFWLKGMFGKYIANEYALANGSALISMRCFCKMYAEIGHLTVWKRDDLLFNFLLSAINWGKLNDFSGFIQHTHNLKCITFAAIQHYLAANYFIGFGVTFFAAFDIALNHIMATHFDTRSNLVAFALVEGKFSLVTPCNRAIKFWNLCGVTNDVNVMLEEQTHEGFFAFDDTHVE